MGLKTNPAEKDAYALIVGIATYKDSKIPKLNYTTHDAQAIFDLLVNPDMAGFKKENIKIFLDEEATSFNIKDAISNWLFKNAKEDSMVFIFFAGHGGVEEDRLGIEKDNLAKYLLPYDADFDNFFASALSNSDFNKLLLSIKSKRLVVFMDSCYSGGVSEKKARDVKIVEDPYEKMAEGEGRLVIAASQPDQRSFEDEKLSHGIFTHHLIEALKGKADLDNDGCVTAMEVYKYLSETVTKTARHRAGGVQEPILRGDLKTDFVLTVNRKRIEEIKDEDIKKKNLKRLSDWYHEGELSPTQYELACRLIESSVEDLSGDDKKVLKSLNDLLSNKISILTFQHDVKIIKGLEEPPLVKPKVEEERKKEEEGEIKKKRIIELSSQAQKLFGEKKYTEAIAKWQEVLKLDSANRKTIEGIEEANRILKELEEKKRKIDDLNISAQQLYNEGKFTEAIDEWWKVLDLDLENQTAKEGIKNAKEKLKEKEREKIGELSSQAQKLFGEKKYTEAIGKWQEVLKLDSANRKAIEGIKEANRILEELEEKRKIDELNTSAQQLCDEGKYHEAVDTWKKVLDLDSENQTAKEGIKKTEEEEKKKRIIGLSSQAQKLFEEKNYIEAIAKWQKVRKLDPDNRKTIEGIEKAKKILEEINELNISAQQLYDEGKYQEAIDEWRNVLDLDSENQMAMGGIKKVEEKIKEKEWEAKGEKIKVKEKLQVKKYCPSCGHPNTGGLKYCVQCGAKLFEA